MKKLHWLAILTMAGLLVLGGSPAEAAKAKKKKPVHGVVTAVDNAKAPGKITVRVQANKKKKAPDAAQAMEKVFSFDQTTKFEKLTSKKKQVQSTPATFADVHKNDAVLIDPGKADLAQSVKILSKKKGKKAA
jgi:hypothetical protein